MDDRRFDSLTRSLASGSSRRQVLKGLLGLGGAAAAAGSLASEADAARRPKPTPVPTCPGVQTWNGSACVCPGGHTKCGPDCCPDGLAECCDNACCYGTCYGEELCCPSAQEFCPISGECCPEGSTCCPDYGCLPPEAECCSVGECPDRDCLTKACSANHLCEYLPNCTLSDDCCVADTCYRNVCDAMSGQCSGQILDCSNGGAEVCCSANQACLENGLCGCAPQCEGKECGDDGCWGTCGICPLGELCNANQVCQACSVCGTYESCGSDSEWGFCGTACIESGGTACLANRLCESSPACSNDNECPAGEFCLAATCCDFPSCVPVCDQAGARLVQGAAVEETGPTALLG